ncbi:competence protein ComA [Thermus parvatiensis]|uniref:Competence protein ComA n=2 Tax=Thermus TaxID=270 RepID=A0A0X8D8G0_9DEIN|nr:MULTISPECIES: PaaI family thioesterase [Thermus]AMA75255.1 competence protein ComA [Thermus parvatiensis]VCU52342.1 1,4-dihydroxy-2-naphthoyl-CoA hydrolase [Thermus thermophilus]
MEVKAFLERETLDRTLGVRYLKAEKDEVVAELEVTPKVHQPFGFLHGGATVALAESVASVGGFLNCPPGHAAFGLEINCNHLRKKREGTIRAVGRPLHVGRTTQVWEVKVYDEEGRLVAASRCTLAVVPLEPAKEPA